MRWTPPNPWPDPTTPGRVLLIALGLIGLASTLGLEMDLIIDNINTHGHYDSLLGTDYGSTPGSLTPTHPGLVTNRNTQYILYSFGAR